MRSEYGYHIEGGLLNAFWVKAGFRMGQNRLRSDLVTELISFTESSTEFTSVLLVVLIVIPNYGRLAEQDTTD